MPMFKRGDVVIACADEQRVIKGRRYVVEQARELFWGVVVYDLQGVEDGARASVSNGHRLLTRWTPAPTKAVFDDLAVYA